MKVYQKGKGKPPQTNNEAAQKLFEAPVQKSADYYPYIRGKYIQRWGIQVNQAWLNYGPHLAEPRTIDLFMGPRILVRRIVGERLILVPVESTLIADQLLHTVKPREGAPDYRYIAGILGSKILAYYFQKRYNRTEKTFPEIRVGELAQLPIRTINFSDPTDKARHDKMVALVERMLTLHKELPGAKSPYDKQTIERQIEATDAAIDRLVYDLYGLTEEEISVVEGR